MAADGQDNHSKGLVHSNDLGGVRDGIERDLESGLAAKHLVEYYAEHPPGSEDGYTGRWFDQWSDTAHPDKFTTTDFYAVTALSVSVPPRAGAAILASDHFASMLAQLPTDQDLWEIDADVLATMNTLNLDIRKLSGIGPTTASKLMAAKRPRLVPIYDSVVERRLKPPKGGFWQAMHDTLKDEALRAKDESVRSEALAIHDSPVPADISLLRVIDVVVWKAGTTQPST